MLQYCEIAMGDVRNRHHFIPVNKLAGAVKEARRSNQPLYRSYFYFDESIVEHAKKYKSTQTYQGNYHIPYLLFDIDKGTDTGAFVYERAVDFLDKLLHKWKIPETAIQIYFSGTGFHIVTADFFKFQSGSNLPLVVKETFSKHFKVDTSFLNPRGLIRMPFTINRKSDLYKVPLTYSQFMNKDYEEICAYAKECDDDMLGPIAIKEEGLPDYSKFQVEPSYKPIKYESEQFLPTRIITCGQKMYDSGAVKGSRNRKLLRLVSIFRRQGLNFQMTYDLLSKWCSTLEKTQFDKTVNEAWNKGYQFGCKDELMTEFCDSKCIYYSHKNYGAEIHKPSDIVKRIHDRIITFKSEHSVNLKTVFPNIPHNFLINPQETCVIIGDTGLGKTALVQTIAVVHTNLKILYLTFEVGANLLTRRFLQIAHNMTAEEVQREIERDPENADFITPLSHISIIENAIDKNEIRKNAVQMGANVIVLDVLDGIKTVENDLTKKTQDLANDLQDMVKELNVIMIIVHHISKQASGSPRLTVHSGKGSSGVEQKGDIVLALEGDQLSPPRLLSSKKARDAKPFEIKLIHNFKTMRYEPVMSRS